MGDINPWWVGGGVALVLLALAARWVLHLCRAVQIERARELFRLQHERFEELLLKAAAATGKPRGLAWMSCGITGDAVLARETGTRRIVAFVPVVVQFEPIEGSDMEDVPAARDPRPATALFDFLRGHWHTDGRILFNLDPRQALGHFGKQFAAIKHR